MDPGITVDIERTCEEAALIEELLSLDGKDILELGCGRAELTRTLARAGRDRRLLALEVDRIQHGLNLELDDLPNVTFGLGGAEAIPAEDRSQDVVFLFKSLHHVPPASMDQALSEMSRVLRPGGYAYVSEPIFRGPLNEVLRLFHDESRVRQQAFEALVRAVDSGRFRLERELYFLAPRHFRNFAEFEERIIRATHSNHALGDGLLEQVREAFERRARPRNGRFEAPIRVDLLRRP